MNGWLKLFVAIVILASILITVNYIIMLQYNYEVAVLERDYYKEQFRLTCETSNLFTDLFNKINSDDVTMQLNRLNCEGLMLK